MIPHERVEAVINHQTPDRMPVYFWLRANLMEMITEEFGSLEVLEDQYEFDFAHLFGGAWCYDKDPLQQARADGPLTPARLLDVPMADPDVAERYDGLRDQVRHHKEERGRFVYVQTPGIFEANNGNFGIENHLMYLALYPDDLKRVYQRQAEWNRKFAMNCLDIGIDMIHVSDDWGGQTNLLFSPQTWWEMMHPYHKITADAVKSRGGYLSLHSDGNVSSVVDGIIDLGFDVVHPWQESAGMSFDVFREKYQDAFTIMGGLDVQTTIGFGKLDFLVAEIERVMTLFADGGMLFCTSHFVQEHCSLEELRLALDTVRRFSAATV